MSADPQATSLDLEEGAVYEPDPRDDEMVSVSLDRQHASSAVETATTAQSSMATTTTTTTTDDEVSAEVSTSIPLGNQSTEELLSDHQADPLGESSAHDTAANQQAPDLPAMQPQPITAATAYSFRGEELPSGGENVPRNGDDDDLDDDDDDDDSILEIPIRRRQRDQMGQGEQQVEEFRRCPCGSRIFWAHVCHSLSRCVKWICLPLILFLAASGFLLFLLFFCIPLICFLVILICFYYSCTEDPIPPRILFRALWSNEAGGGAMDAALGGGLGANSSTTPTYTAEQLKRHLIRRACLEISEGKNLEGAVGDDDDPIKTSVTEVTATSLESTKVPDEDTKQELDDSADTKDTTAEAGKSPAQSGVAAASAAETNAPTSFNLDERIRVLEEEQGAVSLTAEKGNHLHEGPVYLVTEETERLLVFSAPLPYEEDPRAESSNETTNGFTELANNNPDADNGAVASNESTELVTVETALATTGARVPPPASTVSSSDADGPQDVDTPDGVSDDDDDSNWNWSVAEGADADPRSDTAISSRDDGSASSTGSSADRVADVEGGSAGTPHGTETSEADAAPERQSVSTASVDADQPSEEPRQQPSLETPQSEQQIHPPKLHNFANP